MSRTSPGHTVHPIRRHTLAPNFRDGGRHARRLGLAEMRRNKESTKLLAANLNDDIPTETLESDFPSTIDSDQ
jgi:hypothetical protein